MENLFLALFENNLKKVELAKDETRAEVEKYLKDKYEHFKAFLQEAVDREECIKCSL